MKLFQNRYQAWGSGLPKLLLCSQDRIISKAVWRRTGYIGELSGVVTVLEINQFRQDLFQCMVLGVQSMTNGACCFGPLVAHIMVGALGK